jgi:hypothetical protein
MSYRKGNKYFWIQDALKHSHQGLLRKKVRNEYGSKGFTKSGAIRLDVLQDLAGKSGTKVQKEAVLARTLRSFHK